MGHFERYLLGELQVCELRFLWKFGGDQPSGLQHLLSEHRGLHQGLELEGEGEGDRHGALGRGPLHAEVHGLAWCGQGLRLGAHDRLDVQSFPAGGPEEREVETELRIDSDSGDAPIHEAIRLLRVLEGHTAMMSRDALPRNVRGLSIQGTWARLQWMFTK